MRDGTSAETAAALTVRTLSIWGWSPVTLPLSSSRSTRGRTPVTPPSSTAMIRPPTLAEARRARLVPVPPAFSEAAAEDRKDRPRPAVPTFEAAAGELSRRARTVSAVPPLLAATEEEGASPTAAAPLESAAPEAGWACPRPAASPTEAAAAAAAAEDKACLTRAGMTASLMLAVAASSVVRDCPV